MAKPAVIPDSQHAFIDELLARQDDVIERLDQLEKRLVNTIEEIRPSKNQDGEMPDSAETEAVTVSEKRAA